MNFNWEDYLKLAHHLVDENNNYLEESSYRTSISRAYYSVFNMAKHHLIDSGEKLSKGADIHQQIPLLFESLSKQAQDKNKQRGLTRISIGLTILRRLRNKADYDDKIKELSKEATGVLIRAENVKDIIISLRK